VQKGKTENAEEARLHSLLTSFLRFLRLFAAILLPAAEFLGGVAEFVIRSFIFGIMHSTGRMLAGSAA
jgi:hypothetical protein